MAAAADASGITPSSEEGAMIAKVREAVAPELAKLEAEGKAFVHTTGDLFFLRLVRGNDTVDGCVKWFRNCLDYRERFKLDDVYTKACAGGMKWKIENMPHYDLLCSKYVTHVFDEDLHRTKQGDLLWYQSWGDRKLKEMMDEVPLETLKEFTLTIIECRWARLDALSRETGRMMKLAIVLDVEGISLGGLDKRFSRYEKEVGQPAVMHCSIEALDKLFIINFPSWAKTVYTVTAAVFPKRMVDRFRVLGDDFQSHPEFVADMPAGKIPQFQTSRKCAFPDNTSMEGKGRIIGAGAIMERVVEVKAGCQVLWNFKVGTNADADEAEAGRGLLGSALDAAAGEATDILFQVKFMPSLESVIAIDGIKSGDVVIWEEHVVDVVPPTTVDGAMGQLDGKTVTDREGLVTVSWNNAASWVRGRVLANYQLVVNRPDDDVGSFHSGDD